MGELLRPFEFEFFRNGVIVATFAGALCGMVGVIVVLRGMSYIGHGLSHSIFGGYAASALIGVNYVLGAGLWGVVSALMISGVTRRRVIGADAAIGVITTASFALGLALFAVFGRRGRSFDAALFGSVLGVGSADVWTITGLTIAVAVAGFFGYRRLLFTTFDPEVAAASGVRTGIVDACVMLVLATGIGGACGFVGMNASYHADVQPGPSIVLVGAALFTVVFVVTGSRGRRRTIGLIERSAADALRAPGPRRALS